MKLGLARTQKLSAWVLLCISGVRKCVRWHRLCLAAESPDEEGGLVCPELVRTLVLFRPIFPQLSPYLRASHNWLQAMSRLSSP